MVPLPGRNIESIVEKIREIVSLLEQGKIEQAHIELISCGLGDLVELDPGSLLLFLTLLLDEMIKYL